MPRLGSDEPCPPGDHETAYDGRTGMSRCTNCGIPAQELSANPRTAVKGDYRVVCHGAGGGGSCPIGPSRVVPGALPEMAIDLYNDHQRQAIEMDGEPHDAEVFEF